MSHVMAMWVIKDALREAGPDAVVTISPAAGEIVVATPGEEPTTYAVDGDELRSALDAIEGFAKILCALA